MRLNLGCGANKLEGWTNVDKFAYFKPDQVVDLEQFPWPWGNDQADEILLHHVLEHLGAQPSVYFGVMQELWRVCRDGAHIAIAVPHPRHDDFLSDPTHVRPITLTGLAMLSRKVNEQWLREGSASSMLALYLGVDFDIVSDDFTLEEPWAGDFNSGRLDKLALLDAMQRYNNVIKEQRFVLRAVKQRA
jgi:hypothetical protein